MKFIIGFVTGWILLILLAVGLFFYFDLQDYTLTKDDLTQTSQQTSQQTDQQTDETTETYNPPLDQQQENYDENIKSMTDEEYAEWEKENYPPQKHNNAGVNNYEYAKKHGLMEE